MSCAQLRWRVVATDTQAFHRRRFIARCILMPCTRKPEQGLTKASLELTFGLRPHPLGAFGLGGCLRPSACAFTSFTCPVPMSALASLDHSKAARRGPDPLPERELRTHTVSVRLNGDELAQLDGQRAPVQMQRGEYLRCAALHQLPPTIPPVNQAAFVELSRSASNLNQIARSLNEAARGSPEHEPSITQIVGALDDFRRALIGAKLAGEADA